MTTAPRASFPDPETHPGEGFAPFALADVLRDGRLSPYFQPVVDLVQGRVFGHESLIRGPAHTMLHSPAALFAEARRQGLHPEVEFESLRVGLRSFHDNASPGKLFLNLSGPALAHYWLRWRAELPARLLEGCDLDPAQIILELTDTDPAPSDLRTLVEACSCLRDHGMRIALDDYGVGNTSLRLWAELQPDFVKFDRYFFNGLSRDARKQKLVRTLLTVAQGTGTPVVAEGIETADDLDMLSELGIRYAQGWYLGRPEALLIHELAMPVRESLRARIPSLQGLRGPGSTAASLRVDAPAVPHLSYTNDDVHRLFMECKGLHAVAVVDDDNRPIGIINRRDFSEQYAQRYTRDLFGRDPCSTFMNPRPVLVDIDTSIDQLSHVLISEDQRYLMDGFIITRDGRYDALGTGEALVRSVTEMRLEAARYANPLTSLPGNIPISQHIGFLLDAGDDFAVCYGDLNNFKPFNDVYGYWRGDDMILLCAEVIKRHCDAQRDFVGHVGGDDFVVMMRSPDWKERVGRIISEFNQRAVDLYDDPGRRNGGIEAEDRHGVLRFFPFVTLGIGALTVTPPLERLRPEDIASAAAHVKHKVKHGNLSLVVEPFAELSPKAGAALPARPPAEAVAGTVAAPFAGDSA